MRVTTRTSHTRSPAHPPGAAFLMDWANSALMPGLLNMATVICGFHTLMPKLTWMSAGMVTGPLVKSMGRAGGVEPEPPPPKWAAHCWGTGQGKGIGWRERSTPALHVQLAHNHGAFQT